MNPLDKPFKLAREDIKQLITPMGGCLATDRIVVDGCEVGYMYREASSQSVASGWTFMAGDEDEEYVDNPDHWAIYEVNTICNYDQTIIPYLDAPTGTAWGKDLGAKHFQKEPMPCERD
ncbi:MAG TPA: DUF2185 domain-containing protein [Prosthecobacter sp.]|nr:DUF2185 domain-containing protein [Prosthecobacter sp.]